jgi:hypothetical protein
VREKIKKRKIVIINQASNYLTIGLANAFLEKFEEVSLITGSIRVQGEELNPKVKIVSIIKWQNGPIYRKIFSYIGAIVIFFILLVTKYRKHEVFFIGVPPMAYFLNLVLRNRFSMLIWDVYPDAFRLTGMKESHLIYKLWSKLNKLSFSKAYKIFIIGDKMSDLMESYIDKKKLIVQPIWSIFNNQERISKIDNPFIKKYSLEDKFIVQYSGNIGLSHKVELVVELAERLKEFEKIHFQIIGRGPRNDLLKKLVDQKGLTNCQFLPFQSEAMFPFSLSAADLGVVILDEAMSKGSVPSKSYNLMSIGIPSLYIAGKDSELFSYTEKYNHAVCYTENDLNKVEQFILSLSNSFSKWSMYSMNAKLASKNFTRDNADKIVESYLK